MTGPSFDASWEERRRVKERALALSKGNWPLLAVVRCGAQVNARTCGRAVGPRLFATPEGPLLYGESIRNDFYEAVLRSNPERMASLKEPGERWTSPGGILLELLDEVADGWWPSDCDRGHSGVLLAEHLRSRRKRKVVFTVEVTWDADGDKWRPVR